MKTPDTFVATPFTPTCAGTVYVPEPEVRKAVCGINVAGVPATPDVVRLLLAYAGEMNVTGFNPPDAFARVN
jgi:hypothetical protein